MDVLVLARLQFAVTTNLHFLFVILAANSYLQNPVGSRVVDGRLVLDDFGALVANPHLLTALPHVVGAALLSAAWVAIEVSAHHLRRGRAPEFFALNQRWGVCLAAAASVLVFVSGHRSAGPVEASQPGKFDAVLTPVFDSMMLVGDLLGLFTLLVLLPMLWRGRLARARRVLRNQARGSTGARPGAYRGSPAPPEPGVGLVVPDSGGPQVTTGGSW